MGNTDGTGSVHVKDGKFVVNKWSIPFDEVVEKKLPLFDHMPYNGWTIGHVRAASHGGNTYNNTHPLVKGEWAMAHNGIFQEYAIVKALMTDHTFIGQTDSEAAAALWEKIGRAGFIQAMDSGVFLFLNKNGQLDVVGCSGDLVYQNTKWGVLMASELPHTYRRTINVDSGDFRLSKKGKAFIANFKREPSYENVEYYGGNEKYYWSDKKVKGRKIKIVEGEDVVWSDSFDDEIEAAKAFRSTKKDDDIWMD
jgi:predicted glutamine amidotransferase